MNYTLRQTRDADLAAVQRFFIKAYGPETTFQSAAFLKWYFAHGDGRETGAIESLIALDHAGEVVAHYGGLPRTLLLHGQPVSLVWGASAFTLPEWRAHGIGKRLVEQMMDRYDIFGVIGFSAKAAEFYREAGFNVFEKQRFNRFVLNLAESTFRLAGLAGHDPALVRARLPVVKPPAFVALPPGVELREISTQDTGRWQWQFAATVSATARREFSDLHYRFFGNPFIRYRCFAAVQGDRVLTGLFTRRETAGATGLSVERIIDLSGDPAGAAALLAHVGRVAEEEGASFVDFASIGSLYRDAMDAAGFAVLENDETGMLPQVMAPPEARPNMEFLGLFSRRFAEGIAALRASDVYFTRADSDRDRIARLSQTTNVR